MNQVFLVHPSTLTDQHLDSELKTLTTAPNNFDSTDGNISFFRDKLHFLNLRCSLLRIEYQARHGKAYEHHWKIQRRESPELWQKRYVHSELEADESFEEVMNTLPDTPLVANKPISSGIFRMRKIVIDHLREGMTVVRPFMCSEPWEFNGRIIRANIEYHTVDREDREFLNKLVADTGMTKFDLTDPTHISKLAMYFVSI